MLDVHRNPDAGLRTNTAISSLKRGYTLIFMTFNVSRSNSYVGRTLDLWSERLNNCEFLPRYGDPL